MTGVAFRQSEDGSMGRLHVQAGQGLRCKGKTSQAIWIGDFYSEGYCDCSAVPLDTEWYRRTPITMRRSSREILQLALLST